MSREPGIEVASAGDQAELADVELRGVTPTLTDWLPDALEDLRPLTASIIREHIATVFDDTVLEERRVPTYYQYEILTQTLGVTGLEGAYTGFLTKWSVEYHDSHPNRHGHRPDVEAWLDERLTEIGTGEGYLNSGVDALEDTVAAVLGTVAEQVGREPPLIRVYLDADAWSGLDDSRRGRRTLDALAALATGARVELVVSSRELAQTLGQRHGEWLESEAGLTDLRDWFRQRTPIRADVDDDVRAVAADALDALDENSGRVELLAALEDADAKTVKQLKRDADVSVAAGTVDRYVPDLQGEGLVTVERRSGQSNRVSLTPAGSVVCDHIADDLSLRDPSQASLRAALLQPLTRPQVQCTERGRVERGDHPGQSAEEWLVATGEASAADDAPSYVQWLDGPDRQMDAWGMHQRLSASFRVEGVNAVDERIGAFEDGRVGYISCFDNEFLAVLQWGGPLATLGRLANILLSRRALSKVLGPDAVGEQWQDLYEGLDVSELDAGLEELMRWGDQIGWFSEDEARDWASFFDRIGGVRARCLRKLGEVKRSQTEKRAELFEDLHGLVATATALYDAAGVDIGINIRVPNITELLRKPKRFRDFCDFFAKTVPKQATYESSTGRHSWWRTCIEDREEKLQHRLPVGYSEHAPEASLRASWCITGPTATDLLDDVQDAIENEITELRDRIGDRVEAAPVLNVPVANAGTISHLTTVIEDCAGIKNYETADGHVARSNPEAYTEVRNLARLFLRTLSTPERPQQCAPTDVAEALLRLSRTEYTADYLDVDDVEYAISQLPADRVLPNHLPSKTAIFQALLAADGPIGRSEIIAKADISGSTYDRHIQDVRDEFGALDLVEETTVEGRPAMTATIAPWWDAELGGETPDETAGLALSEGCDPRDPLFELAAALGIDVDPDLFLWDTPTDEQFSAHEAFYRWRGFITDICSPPGSEEDDVATVTLGVYPKEPPGEQLSLEQSSSESSRASTPAMPSYPNHSRPESTDGAGEGLE